MLTDCKFLKADRNISRKLREMNVQSKNSLALSANGEIDNENELHVQQEHGKQKIQSVVSGECEGKDQSVRYVKAMIASL